MTKPTRKPLLPERHPQMGFFVCDVLDSAPKSDTASMQYPLFTLSTKPDHTARNYQQGKKFIRLGPSPLGLATVHDRDILIYCISHCMQRVNAGERIERTLRLNAADLMAVTNRQMSGEGYRLLRAALKRLQGTQIETNITTGDIEQWEMFSFIESARTIRKTRDGRMIELEITLSDWVFNAIRETEGEILTIHRDYFRLRKPLERRLYEIARKHCGTKNKEWRFTLETLQDRTGSQSKPKEFKRMVRAIIANQDHIPDYRFELVGETLYIFPKGEFAEKFAEKALPAAIDQVHLKPATIEKVRQFCGRLDVYAIEQDWRAMLVDKPLPDRPDGSFVNYAKWYVNERGGAVHQ